jgi:putative peptide zinc metalloprotease protein
VTRGQALVSSDDPELTTQVAVLRAHEAELMSKLESVRFSDRVEAVVTQTELSAVRTELARNRYLAGMLNARAEVDGVFAMPQPDDAPGRFYKRGDIIGYVLPREGARVIRAAVSQEDIELVRHHVRMARIKLTDRLDEGIDVRSIREVPSGKDQLPSAAIGTGGGGDMLVDPRDEHGLTALNRVFLVDLELAEPVPRAGFGGRAHVRFDLEWEPLGQQLWRRMRQLLLSRVEI